MKKSVLILSLLLGFTNVYSQNEADNSYDDLMYMSSVYPVEIIENKAEDADSAIVETDAHTEAIQQGKTKKSKNPLNLIYAVANQKGLVYAETDEEQEVKAVHVVNPNGHEVLCFPMVIPHHNLVKLDLSSLGPGRFTLILEGRFISTRDIIVNDKQLVALLR